MATFSVNQVRHLYVVNAAADLTAGKDLADNLYLTLKDADGKDVRSDLITNVEYTRATAAEDLQRKTKVVKIAFASGVSPVAGEDYVLTIKYSKFISQSDEDTYTETGAARATSTTAGDLLLVLAKSLAANTKEQEMVEVKVLEGATEKAVSAATAANVTAILVKEIEQPWLLGIRSSEPVCFNVYATPAKLTAAGTEGEWAAITDATSTNGATIGNGKKIADLEYFCMGERASEYRLKGWPYVWHTKYMVDPAKQYDVIDIHYAYIGSNHAIQKSEKDLTLVIPVGAVGSEDHSITAAVIAKINALNVITIYDPSNLEEE